MAKFKIQKNLSDADMFKGFSDEESFEDKMLKMDEGIVLKTVKQNTKKAQEKSQDDFYREFLTDNLTAQIGKALLDIKMAYFKDGCDFSIQVKRDGRNIVLETAPKQFKN